MAWLGEGRGLDTVIKKTDRTTTELLEFVGLVYQESVLLQIVVRQLAMQDCGKELPLTSISENSPTQSTQASS